MSDKERAQEIADDLAQKIWNRPRMSIDDKIFYLENIRKLEELATGIERGPHPALEAYLLAREK